MWAGCQAAVTAINAAGGVLGHKVDCMAVDTEGNPAAAVTAAAKMLATTPHLLGVLGPSSDEADATAPLINAAKVPMFADTGEASFDHNKLPYFWRMIPADDVRGYAMALYAKQKGYLRGAAVFGNDVGGAQTGVPTLLKGYSEVGGQMVVNQIAQAGPDLLSVAGPGAHRGEAAGHLHRNLAAGQRDVPGRAAAAGPPDPGHRHRRDDPAELVHRDGRVDRQAGADQVLRCRVALRPSVGARVAAVQQGPAGVTLGAQAGAVEHRLVHDVVLRRGPPHGAGRDRTKSTNPSVWNAIIPSLTTSGAVLVHTYAEGLAALKAGKKIDYVGATGIIAFNQWHNSGGGFEIAAYQSSGNLNLVTSISAAQLAPLIK